MLLHSSEPALLPVLIDNTIALCALYGAPDTMSLPEDTVKALASLPVPSTAKFEFGIATEKLAT